MLRINRRTDPEHDSGRLLWEWEFDLRRLDLPALRRPGFEDWTLLRITTITIGGAYLLSDHAGIVAQLLVH